MTPEVLSACTGARIDRARTHASFVSAAMTEFGIDTPARQAAFLAQIGWESGGLHWAMELWGPTPQQLRYEPPSELATKLGNTMAGDGLRYRGHGWIMITGRFNHGHAGNRLGVDLINHPDLGAQPDVASRISGLFWSEHHLNPMADIGTDDAFVEITQVINGGTNGLAGRQKLWAFAKTALGIT